jgi:hypothetical protein
MAHTIYERQRVFAEGKKIDEAAHHPKHAEDG